jgi:predicted RNA binding protein YcfA (HicA-like mRNA interferase family)
VPRKVRDLIRDLLDAGFYQIQGGGKGSHRKFSHVLYPGAVTLSGAARRGCQTLSGEAGATRD